MRDRIRGRLRELAGEDSLLPADRFAVLGVEPAAVIAPASAEQAAAVLAEASAEGWIVEPAGSGTALDWGRPPTRVDVVLSTRRLDRVREYVPADLTIGVDAGIGMDALDRRLEAEGQWLALDPPAAEGATLGAVFAGGLAGPLETGFGRPRDAALGVQLVTGDGRILDLGGRVVKNVAGYDLVRLAVGSHGTLGLITRLHLRLRPRPAADRTLAVGSAGTDALLELAPHAAEHGAVAVELLSPELARMIARPGDDWLLLARFAGSVESVADGVGAFERTVRVPDSKPLSDQTLASCWQRLARAEAAAAFCIRLSDLPSRDSATLEAAVAAARGLIPAIMRSGSDVTGSNVAVHAGRGVARVWTTVVPSAEAAATAVRAARQAVGRDGGRVVVTRAVAAVAGALDPFGEPTGLELMRGLKRVFDPAGVVSPGRWVV